MMMALFFRQQVAEALAGRRAGGGAEPERHRAAGRVRLRLAQSGEWARGGALIEQALARNPARAGYYHGVLALVAYMRRDDRRALAEIRQAGLDKLSFFHGIAAIIYAEVGMRAEAAEAGARFAALNPGFVADPEGELTRRDYRPEDRGADDRGHAQAGLPVRTAAVVR